MAKKHPEKNVKTANSAKESRKEKSVPKAPKKESTAKNPSSAKVITEKVKSPVPTVEKPEKKAIPKTQKSASKTTEEIVHPPLKKQSRGNSEKDNQGKVNHNSLHKKGLSDTKPPVDKKIKLEFPKVRWGTDSIISFEATDRLPPQELTSISGGFVFHDDKLVLANIPGRGWEIIGGRIDIGESPEQTFVREAHHQIGVTLNSVKMIGVIRIEHTGPQPPNCPYPYPISYGAQYIGIVNELLPFRGGENSLGRSLITQDGFKEHYFEWNEFIDAVFRYAFSEYKQWLKKNKENP